MWAMILTQIPCDVSGEASRSEEEVKTRRKRTRGAGTPGERSAFLPLSHLKKLADKIL